MYDCKLGEHGCYEDGKCHYKKPCENQITKTEAVVVSVEVRREN